LKQHELRYCGLFSFSLALASWAAMLALQPSERSAVCSLRRGRVVGGKGDGGAKAETKRSDRCSDNHANPPVETERRRATHVDFKQHLKSGFDARVPRERWQAAVSVCGVGNRTDGNPHVDGRQDRGSSRG
jgi:hypothetical protein